MHNPLKIAAVIFHCLLLFSPCSHAAPAVALSNAVLKSHVPVQALRDALELRDKLAQTSHSFRFYALAPFDGRPSTLGFTEQILEGIFPTIGTSRFIVIFDLDRPSSSRRFHIIDHLTGAIESVEAAHGVGSECGGTRSGYACAFISDRESKASPLGFFVTGETYNAHSGPAIRINGLESKSFGFPGNDVPSTIIIHGASYVHRGHAGLSWGCPALNPLDLGRVKNKLTPGTLFYFYHSSLNFAGRAPIVEMRPQSAAQDPR